MTQFIHTVTYMNFLTVLDLESYMILILFIYMNLRMYVFGQQSLRHYVIQSKKTDTQMIFYICHL